MILQNGSLHNRLSINGRTDLRSQILVSFGATVEEVKELLHYNENHFDLEDVVGHQFPLPDELFVEEWQTYVAEAAEAGSVTAIYPYLPQLQFPVQPELRNRVEYVDAVKHGKFSYPDGIATGLILEAPERCLAFLHPTAAGRIPVLCAGSRADFIALIRAFTKKGEPELVPDSMGAIFINGYNNLRRFNQLKTTCFQSGESTSTWAEMLPVLRQQKQLFQDRFIIVGPGPYSGVPAASLRLEEAEWDRLSLDIRLGHECAHYFTRRVLGSMQNNLLDELIADYCGLDTAIGRYPSRWVLLFLGLEDEQEYRPGGRMENYGGTTQLSSGSFRVLGRMVRAAVANLQRMNTATAKWRGAEAFRVASILTMAASTLEDLAAPQAWRVLVSRFRMWRESLSLYGETGPRTVTGSVFSPTVQSA